MALDRALARAREGLPGAEDELFALVYEDLRNRARVVLARLGSRDSLLQATALVNEAYLRMRGKRWKNPAHFTAVSARAMRTIIIDYYRRRTAGKRIPRELTLRLGTLHDVSDPRVESTDAHLDLFTETCALLRKRSEQAAELIDIRYFTALSVLEIAELYGIPLRTMETKLATAKALFAATWKELES